MSAPIERTLCEPHFSTNIRVALHHIRPWTLEQGSSDFGLADFGLKEIKLWRVFVRTPKKDFDNSRTTRG